MSTHYIDVHYNFEITFHVAGVDQTMFIKEQFIICRTREIAQEE
jgi:hypothetical protein